MSKAKQTGTILGSLIIGALAGGIAALLLTPHSGEETREKLKKEADRLREELKDYSSDFSDRAKKVKKDFLSSTYKCNFLGADNKQ
ncbi:YtxH domain-containing protein [Ornithobacterium rhinotracheale]